jgi:predicted enzyme related to lactoylglutathione lyase
VTPAVAVVVIDTVDPARLAAFWSRLLEVDVVDADDDWIDVGPLAEGGPLLAFQRVPEAKTDKNRLHLDVRVRDLADGAARAAALGARPLAAARGTPNAPWQVFADPEGNEFCLVTN